MGSAGRDRVTGELIAGKEDVTAPYFLVKRRNIAKTRSCSTRLRKGWGTMGSLPRSWTNAGCVYCCRETNHTAGTEDAKQGTKNRLLTKLGLSYRRYRSFFVLIINNPPGLPITRHTSKFRLLPKLFNVKLWAI